MVSPMAHPMARTATRTPRCRRGTRSLGGWRRHRAARHCCGPVFLDQTTSGPVTGGAPSIGSTPERAPRHPTAATTSATSARSGSRSAWRRSHLRAMARLRAMAARWRPAELGCVVLSVAPLWSSAAAAARLSRSTSASSVSFVSVAHWRGRAGRPVGATSSKICLFATEVVSSGGGVVQGWWKGDRCRVVRVCSAGAAGCAGRRAWRQPVWS